MRLQLVIGCILSSVLEATRVAAEFNHTGIIKGLHAPLSVIYHIFSLNANFQKNVSVACDICSGATRANLQPLQSMFAFTPRDGSVPEARV